MNALSNKDYKLIEAKYNDSKILYLDGLRGIASIIVVFSHLVNGFYPHMAIDLDGDRAITIVDLLWSGNFSVCIFFVLSGFVLTNRFFKSLNPANFYLLVIKRYFRLVIPVFITVLIAYLLYKMSFNYNSEASIITESPWLDSIYNLDHYKYAQNFTYFLYVGLVGGVFIGENLYDTSLWTLNFEFWGSFLIFILCFIIKPIFKYKFYLRVLFYLFMTFILWDTYYVCFIVGMALSDSHVNSRIINNLESYGYLIKKVSWLLLCLALFLGSYTQCHLINSYYSKLFEYMRFSWMHNHFMNYTTLYHIIGAVLLVLSILLNKPIQKILSCNICLYLGKISFSCYLLHAILICTLSSKIFLILINYMSYNLACIYVFIITIMSTIFCSHFYSIYVDEKAVKYSNQIYDKMIKIFPNRL
jgi:peptidoglycan/LPS O-acetylase OafA/YrhL